MRALVKDQLRVVLETSSLLTGQKVLSLTYVPGAAAVPVTSEGDALVLPSEAQGLEQVSASISDIASNINRIPFGEIGQNLNRTLASLERAVGSPELGAPSPLSTLRSRTRTLSS
jgi:paraquat-inducible protein B